MQALLWGLHELHSVAVGILFVLLSGVIYGFLQLFLPGKRPQFHLRLRLAVHRNRRTWWHRVFFIPSTGSKRYQATQLTLQGCGIKLDAGSYLAVKHGVMLCAGLLLALVGTIRLLMPETRMQEEYVMIMIGSAAVLAAGYLDHIWLGKLKQLRREKVMRDVDRLSRQLLYYSGLDVNLHNKLRRCLPLASAIREEWYLLIGEWYQGAEFALRNFRERVATEEAAGFAETIQALRQYDHDRYYELLKERISDYKEKIELLKESRKEAISYLLFVMSGIPILYTFRLFIYPWVSEGQRLFQSLS